MLKDILLPYRWSLVIIILLAMITGFACTVPGLGNNQPTPASTPVVALSSPLPGQALAPGSETKVQSTAIDTTAGIARVELLVDSQIVRIDANAYPEPNTPFIVAQPWLPTPGTHVIQVRAYSTNNAAGESQALTVQVAESVQAAQAIPSATPEPKMDAPTHTPAPLAPTNTPLPPATAAVDRPTPIQSPGTPTATPTATPTPGVFAPTGFEPQERFYEIWQEVGGGKSRLGYPTGPEINGRDFAKQYFQKGLMYWWDNPQNPDFIWVIDAPQADAKSGTSWNRYNDTWNGQDPFSCEAARQNGDKGPLRGFGQLWCSRPELQARLGNPWEQEAGSAGRPPFGRVQFFQGGVMLYNSINSEVFVLFDQGDWQRFDY